MLESGLIRLTMCKLYRNFADYLLISAFVLVNRNKLY